MKKSGDMRRFIGYAFLFNLALGLLVVGTAFLLGKGTYYMGTDYNYQQVPFNILAKTNILSGNIFWLDNFDLGTSFIGALSFYTVGSPFFWLTMLFPTTDYSLILPLLLVLKFAVAGTGAYCYIRQYTKESVWTLIASLLYSFSGYQIFNINYNHFHDVTALFPFLLLALDKTVKEDKKGWFGLMVAVMALTNYFFFIGIVVFLILYFAVKLLCGEYKLTVRLFGRLAVESLLGTGMAMVLLLPNLFFLLGNPRVSENIFSLPLQQLFLLKPYQYADLLRAILFPAESLFNSGMILQNNPTAAELYLPVVGMIPVFAYLVNHRKSWQSRLALVCFVFMIVPVLNSSFTAFNVEYYTRWFFMPLLLFSLMAAQHFENRDSLKPGLILWAGVLGLFCLARLLWQFYFHVEFFPNLLAACIVIACGLVGAAITVFLSRLKRRRVMAALLVCAIFAQTVFTGAIYTYYTHKSWNTHYNSANFFFQEIPDVDYPDAEEYYRTDTAFSYINAGLISDKPSADVFATNVTGSIFEFYYANEMSRAVNSMLDKNLYGFYSLLGVKYQMLSHGKLPDPASLCFSQTATASSKGLDFFANTCYAGMGFAYANAISEKEYAALPQEKRHLVSMDAIVLSEEDLKQYGDWFSIKTAADYANFDHEDFVRSAGERADRQAQNFSYSNGCYRFSVSLEKDTVYYVAIPFDQGFSATVNGQPTEIVKVHNGLQGLVLQAGQNDVEIHYFPQGLKAGLAISGICLLLFVAYLLVNRRKRDV